MPDVAKRASSSVGYKQQEKQPYFWGHSLRGEIRGIYSRELCAIRYVLCHMRCRCLPYAAPLDVRRHDGRRRESTPHSS